jgi:hypothetical protein
MGFILRNRPSPAMVVAFIALCVALAGTATALPGRNKVRSDDIARGAVRSSDIAPKAVGTKQIKGRSVTRSKIAAKAIDSSLVGTDALTGANILESSLGTVPKAASVEALNGLSVKKFAFRTAAVTGPALTKLVELNGLTLSTACERNPAIALTVSASTAISGAIIHSGGEAGTGGSDISYYNEDNTFNVGEPFDVLDTAVSNANSVEGTLTYLRPDGGVVTATYLAEETGTDECVFVGTMTG